jgi:phosphoglycolate phosphatase-like HAD superfamily hydrolase
MSRAFEDVFGVRDGLRGVPMAGRTDAWILAQAVAAYDLPCDTEMVRRFRERYLTHLGDEVHRPGPRKGVMPGVRPLLDALAARHDAFLALLTGNVERGARVKLEYFDLWRYFRCGAFGDSALERNGLLATALASAEACGWRPMRPSDVVVVGDTPLDVAVARAGGVRSVAVATGSYNTVMLGASGANVVLEDFSDLRAALEAFGF